MRTPRDAASHAAQNADRCKSCGKCRRAEALRGKMNAPRAPRTHVARSAPARRGAKPLQGLLSPSSPLQGTEHPQKEQPRAHGGPVQPHEAKGCAGGLSQEQRNAHPARRSGWSPRRRRTPSTCGHSQGQRGARAQASPRASEVSEATGATEDSGDSAAGELRMTSRASFAFSSHSRTPSRS